MELPPCAAMVRGHRRGTPFFLESWPICWGSLTDLWALLEWSVDFVGFNLWLFIYVIGCKGQIPVWPLVDLQTLKGSLVPPKDLALGLGMKACAHTHLSFVFLVHAHAFSSKLMLGPTVKVKFKSRIKEMWSCVK